MRSACSVGPSVPPFSPARGKRNEEAEHCSRVGLRRFLYGRLGSGCRGPGRKTFAWSWVWGTTAVRRLGALAQGPASVGVFYRPGPDAKTFGWPWVWGTTAVRGLGALAQGPRASVERRGPGRSRAGQPGAVDRRRAVPVGLGRAKTVPALTGTERRRRHRVALRLRVARDWGNSREMIS